MVKHRKIAIALHVVNGLLLILLGFILFVLAGAFTACSTNALANDSSVCVLALLLFLGVPAAIAIAPVVALLKYGRTSRRFLWVYSILISVLFIPIGTAVGAHTIYLLRSAANASPSTT
jgi:hypothetical protein